MICPICDQKPLNCDCTETERRQYSEISDMEDLVDSLNAKIASMMITAEERAAIENAIGWIESPSPEDEAMPEDWLPITSVLRALLERTK